MKSKLFVVAASRKSAANFGKKKNPAFCRKPLRLFGIVLALFCAIQTQAADKIRVVATLTDLADFSREIGGDHVEVFSLATGIEDTHGVPMKPSFVPILNRADLIVQVGFGCEHAFLPALLE